MTYFNLLDASKEEGCPICCLLKKSMNKLLEELLYERVTDAGVRKEMRESLGFCALHAWQLQKCGDGFGASIIYEDLVNTVVGSIEKIIATGKGLKEFSQQILKKKNLLKKQLLFVQCVKLKKKQKKGIFLLL